MEINCSLCPHLCRLSEGTTGICGQRQASAGRVTCLSYGAVSSIALDPIEKKPLYHFFPGSQVLSVGSVGCNLKCSFCQNYQIAQQETAVRHMSPGELTRLLTEAQAQVPDCIGLAFTYNEPLIGYEFLVETSRLVAGRSLHTILVTNAFLNPAPWSKLLGQIDAVNIDVKAFTERFYREHCGGSLAPVLRNVERACAQVHVELTYLVIPGLNDSPDEVEAFARWVASLGRDIPVHLTRYFPSYRLRIPATPPDRLRVLAETAREHLAFVYLGNLVDLPETRCPACGILLISRAAQRVQLHNLAGDLCSNCGEAILLVHTGSEETG